MRVAAPTQAEHLDEFGMEGIGLANLVGVGVVVALRRKVVVTVVVHALVATRHIVNHRVVLNLVEQTATHHFKHFFVLDGFDGRANTNHTLFERSENILTNGSRSHLHDAFGQGDDKEAPGHGRNHLRERLHETERLGIEVACAHSFGRCFNAIVGQLIYENHGRFGGFKDRLEDTA